MDIYSKSNLKKNFNLESLENNEILFCFLCEDGLINEAKWLLTNDSRINIHSNQEAPFRLAFKNNNEEIIFWLWYLSKKTIDLNIYDDYCFRKACRNGNDKLLKWLLVRNKKINMNSCDDYAFRKACEYGHYKIVDWLINNNPKINLKSKKNDALKSICKKGHLDIFILIVNKFNVNIHLEKDLLFRITCENGHVPLAKYLYFFDHKINVRMYIDYAFRLACINNHVDMARWLSTIIPSYKFSLLNNKIMNFSYR